jgi:hypothetical protein
MRIWPWSTIAHLKRANRTQADMIQRQALTASQLKDELRSTRAHRDSLLRTLDARLRSSTGDQHGNAEPEFVIVGLDRPGQGKRIMASRHLTGTVLTMTDMSDPPPRWKVTAALGQMLIIDKPGYGDALLHMGTIWRNWERDARPAISSSEKQDWATPRKAPELGR